MLRLLVWQQRTHWWKGFQASSGKQRNTHGEAEVTRGRKNKECVTMLDLARESFSRHRFTGRGKKRVKVWAGEFLAAAVPPGRRNVWESVPKKETVTLKCNSAQNPFMLLLFTSRAGQWLPATAPSAGGSLPFVMEEDWIRSHGLDVMMHAPQSGPDDARLQKEIRFDRQQL